MNKPNIIYFHTHDTGTLIEPYGHQYKTIAINEFLKDAILFENCHCVCPTCSPSRAALLTGTYPHQNGMLGLSHRGFELNDTKKHMAFLLRENGYETVLAGMQHVTKNREILPYDKDLLGEEKAYVKNVMPNALEYLDSVSKTKPFFLSVGFVETHLPYLASFSDNQKSNIEDSICERSKTIEVPSRLKRTKEIKRQMAEFEVDLMAVDNAFGELIKKLKEKGLYDNTIIIVTTDHGVALPFYKCNLTPNGTNVMFLLKLDKKNSINSNCVIDAMVSHMDIFPTICSLTNIEKPDYLEGKCLMPLIEGEICKLHDELFFELTYHAGYEPKRSVMSEKYIYIKNFDQSIKKPVMVNIDNSNSKEFVIKENYHESKEAKEQLYDIKLDPLCVCNLAQKDEYIDIVNGHRKVLYNHLIKTKDEILEGFIKMPKDGYISKPGYMDTGDRGVRISGECFNKIKEDKHE